MIDLADAALRDIDGNPTRLGDLVDRPTVINLVRYYGCAPCRHQLMALAREYDAIRATGGAVVGVGPRAPYQARLLTERGRVPFPLLLDPEHQMARALQLRRQSLLRFIFDLRAWWRWLKGFLRSGQGMITGGWWEVPAMLVVNAEAQVTRVHRGASIGDYPPIEHTLAALQQTIGEGDATPAG